MNRAIFIFLVTFFFTLNGEKIIEISGFKEQEQVNFLKYYKPVKEDYKINMPQYNLPLELNKVSNLDRIKDIYLTKSSEMDMLKKNGFVIVEKDAVDNILTFYEILRKQDIPLYITADTPLHLFHIQFDETLKEIEEKCFYRDLILLIKEMLNASIGDYKNFKGDLKEASRRNVAYFSVALKLLEPDFKVPLYVNKEVEWEIKKIEENKEITDYADARENALFRIPEDYTQYKPRGHYTRSDTLKRYFKAMMWFGRMTFLMKGHEKFGKFIPPDSALTDRETAKIQTLQAMLISSNLLKLKLTDGRDGLSIWERIYKVTSFYAGFADDLSLYDYVKAMKAVFGERFKAEDMLKEDKLTRFLLELSKLSPPKIFSGTGGAGLDIKSEEEHRYTSFKQLDNILNHTMGFRFMGQRYIPDSYILGQLVSPGAGSIPRKIPERFTVVYIEDDRVPGGYYSIRGFPRGLDVFSVFGSKRAEEILKAKKDDEYPKYYEQLEKLRNEFKELKEEDWNRNLYWSWLYALKTLCEERGRGYQTYQRTEAYLDRELRTALASWSALRHNTILYAKQSYTPEFRTTSVEKPFYLPTPKGIVEPIPSFYAKILNTAKMAYEGLNELGVLDEKAKNRLSSLVSTLERLYDICKKQVENKTLTEDDNEFLANFPNALKNAIGDVDEMGLKTTIIADVHTDLNTRECLEEASGYLDYVIVAYKMPDGNIILAVGPVLSYYEFRHPMSDRLTDERWQEMLKEGNNPPKFSF